MDVESLRKLEVYCEAFYTGISHTDKSIHDVLLRISCDTNSIPQLQAILTGSQHPYALIFASSSLLKLFSNCWNRITDKQKDDTKKFVLNYLYNEGPRLLSTTPILLQNLVRLLSRIVKLGWLESIRHQNITEQVRQFLQASTAHWIVGLIIYTTLTEDMQPEGRLQLAKFRRTAMSFRETALSDIFRLAIEMLQQINEGKITLGSPEDEFKLLRQVLHLSVNCLSFDFTGTMVDESNDDQPTVMIPYSWSILRETQIPTLLFTFYKNCWRSAPNSRYQWPEVARLCLQCLVLLSAMRRSFFQAEEDRKLHVSQLIEGTSSIIEHGLGLSHDGCFHELCRLLSKIYGCNAILDLSRTAGFHSWLDHVFQLTISSLENWKRLPNSQHYLVGLWTNMTVPLIYLKQDAPPSVAEYVKKVAIAYIDSRMRIADWVAMIRDGEVPDTDFEDPLSNEVMRAEQISAVAHLSRVFFMEIKAHLVMLFRENEEAIQRNAYTPQRFQQRAAWLIYFIGIVIDVVRGLAVAESSAVSLDDLAVSTHPHELRGLLRAKQHDGICTELSDLVLQLMQKTDNLVSAPEELEMAYLFFLEHLRKAYISSATPLMPPPLTEKSFVMDIMGDKLKSKLVEHDRSLSPSSEGQKMFNLLTRKLFFNLRCRTDSLNVVKKNLKVLNETVVGGIVVCLPNCFSEVISSGQKMLECDVVKEVLKDCQNPSITFLQIPRYAKLRTSYFASITNLILLNSNDHFATFLEQFSPKFNQFISCAAMGEAAFSTPENRQLIIVLARDFCGITSATVAGSYSILFSWLVNNPKIRGASRFEVFTRAVGVWWSDHEVMMPVLTFVAEFVTNTCHRITFENNSPNGIYLVKAVLGLFQEYGTRILPQTEFQDPYRQKYKGIAWALRMVLALLRGHFTNLGVFEAYDDSVLSNVITLGLRLCLSIPVIELNSYAKQLAPYYLFIDHATAEFMDYVVQLEPEALTQLLESMENVCSYDLEIVASCSASIGRLVKYYISYQEDEGERGNAVRIRLQMNSDVLKKLLNIIFQTVFGGDFYQTLSDTLFYLITLFPDEFNRIKEQFILQQIPERQTKLRWHFNDLMTNVTPCLSDASKTQFSNNLFVFAGAVRSFA